MSVLAGGGGGYLGNSFSRGGGRYFGWQFLSEGVGDILGSSFSWLGEDIWVATLAGWVRIFGWQF